jgi:LPS sulfotransferase NodH
VVVTPAERTRVRPARSPGAAYVICATPRTGSYLLCDALARTGVAGRPTEHLSGTYQRFYEKRWHTGSYAEYLDRALAEGTTPNGVFGTKLHRHQLDHVVRQVTGEKVSPPQVGAEVVRQLLGEAAWVFLRRRDTVAQAISYTRSMQTDVWWEADYRPAPSAPPRPPASTWPRSRRTAAAYFSGTAIGRAGSRPTASSPSS